MPYTFDIFSLALSHFKSVFRLYQDYYHNYHYCYQSLAMGNSHFLWFGVGLKWNISITTILTQLLVLRANIQYERQVRTKILLNSYWLYSLGVNRSKSQWLMCIHNGLGSRLFITILAKKYNACFIFHIVQNSFLICFV